MGRAGAPRESIHPGCHPDPVVALWLHQRFPTKAELLKLWEVFETVKYPVLVHCRAGADRAGMASTTPFPVAVCTRSR